MIFERRVVRTNSNRPNKNIKTSLWSYENAGTGMITLTFVSFNDIKFDGVILT